MSSNLACETPTDAVQRLDKLIRTTKGPRVIIDIVIQLLQTFGKVNTNGLNNYGNQKNIKAFLEDFADKKENDQFWQDNTTPFEPSLYFMDPVDNSHGITNISCNLINENPLLVTQQFENYEVSNLFQNYQVSWTLASAINYYNKFKRDFFQDVNYYVTKWGPDISPKNNYGQQQNSLFGGNTRCKRSRNRNRSRISRISRISRSRCKRSRHSTIKKLNKIK